LRDGLDRPELLIADADTLQDRDLSLAKKISSECDVPVITVASRLDPSMIEQTCSFGVFADLLKPVREAELLAAIPLAIQRFDEFRAVREEVVKLHQALEERKLVERAKGILMTAHAIDEPTAFRQLQQLARARRLKMSELAKSVILAREALGTVQSRKTPA
jgi:response regulator NasT